MRCIGFAGAPDVEPHFLANVTLRDGTVRECRIAPTRPPPGRKHLVRGPYHPLPIVEIPVAGLRSLFEVPNANHDVGAMVGAIHDGAAMPPIHATWDGTAYKILDGNHRVAAAKILGHAYVLAYLEQTSPAPASATDIPIQ